MRRYNFVDINGYINANFSTCLFSFSFRSLCSFSWPKNGWFTSIPEQQQQTVNQPYFISFMMMSGIYIFHLPPSPREGGGGYGDTSSGEKYDEKMHPLSKRKYFSGGLPPAPKK